MKYLNLTFTMLLMGLAITASAPTEETTTTSSPTSEAISTTPTPIGDISTTTFFSVNQKRLRDANSKESDEKNSTELVGVDEDILLIFFKKNNNSDIVSDENDSNSTKKSPISISKRDVDRLIQPDDNKDGDDKATSTTADSDEDNLNSTSKGNLATRNSTTEDIILIPLFRPRPILIDVIFFRVNITGFNKTDPHFPSHSSDQGIGHSKPINSDEDSTTFTPIPTTGPPSSTPAKQNVSSSEEETSTRNKSSSSLEEEEEEDVDASTTTSSSTTQSSSKGNHNKARRDIFSHFTNNSQSTTSKPDDGNILREVTFSSSSGGNNASDVTSFGTMSTKKTRPITQETHNADESVSNQPQFGLDEGERSDESDKTRKNLTGNGDIVTTTTENPVVSFFVEIIQYGQNVTNALFGKVGEEHDANPTNRSKLSGSDGNSNQDEEELSSHTTGSTTILLQSSTPLTSSNKNSRNHQPQHVQNGSDSSVQLEQK